MYPIEPNDNDNIVALKTHAQYLDIFKSKSVFLFTGQDPVSGFQCTPHLKDAGIGLAGGPLAVSLTYNVAGRTLAGWQTYSDWARAHPSPYRTAFADPDLYRRVDATQRLYAHRRE